MKELARRAAETLQTRMLAISAVATLFVSTWLSSFSLALSLDDTISVDDFLAWNGGTGAAMLDRWDKLQMLDLVRVALIADLALFIPAYGIFFWSAARALGRQLRCDAAAIDIASFLRLPEQPDGDRSLLERICRFVSLDRLLIAFTLALVVADCVEGFAGLHVLNERSSEYAPIMGMANQIKHGLIVAVFASFVALLLIWFFTLAHPHRRSRSRIGECAGVIRERIGERAVLRRDLSDIVWRSRYSVAAIAFFAVIALLMDQGRDVLIGVALAAGGAETPKLGAVAASVLSVWLFAYVCWLWPRVLCRLQKPSGPGQRQSRAAAPPTATGTPARGLDVPLPASAIPRAETSRPLAPWSSHIAAKWWPRFLGALPMLLLTWLCGLSAQAVYAAVPDAGVSPASLDQAARTGALLLACGAVSALLGLTFFIMRSVAARTEGRRRQSDYFDVLHERAARRELLRGHYKLLLVIPRATVTVIPIAFFGLLIVRWWSLASDGAALALAAVALALALWSSVVGQVSALALRTGTPWVLFGAVLVGVLGAVGWTDNHRVPTIDLSRAGLSLIGMSIAAAAVGLVLLLCWASATVWTRPSRRWKHLATLGWASAAAIGVAAVLVVASGREQDAPRPTGRDAAAGAGRQPAGSVPLNDALIGWLEHLCALEADCPKPDAAVSGSADVKPVHAYIVGSEGGGIRAAYWTALVLARLSTDRPDFARRTFSVSGVSGGAIGAAVWRACWNERALGSTPPPADKMLDCVDQLGRADLLTPLASAWLFEDVLGRFVPTSHCVVPGCAFMSRGLWFERTLEARVGGSFLSPEDGLLAVPLNGWQGAAGAVAAPHVPRLFLNSTVVESGERAIASDVRIDTTAFPNARDQQRELNAALKLSTAAHNAARFPFVNAIGSLQPVDGECLYKVLKVPSGDAPAAASAPMRSKKPGAGTCLHLADGGYFDNSGAQTNQDIVRALARLLATPSASDGVGETQRTMIEWMRPRLQLTAVFIRNGVADATRLKCTDSKGRIVQAPAASAVHYDPSELTCRGPLTLYTDLLGPMVAAKNSGGTGASGRLAESRLRSVIEDFNARAGVPETPSARRSVAPVVPIDLKQGEVLLPLGWYLSGQARDAMRAEAQARTKAIVLP